MGNFNGGHKWDFNGSLCSSERQITVAQSKSNDVHNNPGYEYDGGRVYTICMVISSGARPDLVA